MKDINQCSLCGAQIPDKSDKCSCGLSRPGYTMGFAAVSSSVLESETIKKKVTVPPVLRPSLKGGTMLIPLADIVAAVRKFMETVEGIDPSDIRKMAEVELSLRKEQFE